MPPYTITERRIMLRQAYCPLECVVKVQVNCPFEALHTVKMQLVELIEYAVAVDQLGMTLPGLPPGALEKRNASWGLRDFTITVSATKQVNNFEPRTTMLEETCNCGYGELRKRIGSLFAVVNHLLEAT